MNLYFLVEGCRSEVKVYPAWLSYLLPELQRVKVYDEVNKNNYFLISGQGYPSLLDFIPPAIEEINLTAKYNYFVICLDADEVTVNERKEEVTQFFQDHQLKLESAELIIIAQNRCIETWFLGNRRIYTKNPQNSPLLDYTRFYNVSIHDPELMEKYPGFKYHSPFHEAYLRALFQAKNIVYTKKRPGEVLKEYYLKEVLNRFLDQPEHLKSFGDFIRFCQAVKQELK